MRILVVDDEIVSREKLKCLVANLGECEGAEDGVSALSLVEKSFQEGNFFGVIFLDVLLPDIKGNELLIKIRNIENKKRISAEKKAKIIMVTSFADRDLVIDCKVNGCDDYIVKPFERETVLNKMTALGITLEHKE